MTGRTLGPYQILEKLGEGGMGQVWKAQDTRQKRSAAIKILSNEKQDAQRRRRFLEEARAISALSHPNIVAVYEAGEQDGVDYIAMELVSGRTLEEMLRSRKLRVKEALRYAAQIASGVAAAHAKGILHRDLKPGNIMISDAGTPKVLDFGLAKVTELQSAGEADITRTIQGMTMEGTVVGSAPYMSPEQAEGKRVDARSDVFSFGAVLYEMLTGHQAFRGDSPISTLANILHKTPQPLRKYAPNVPREVEKLIERCLRKDPSRRFQTMADLQVALEDLANEDALSPAAPAPAASSKARWGIAALLVLVFLSTGVAIYLWLSSRVAPARYLTAIPLTVLRGVETDPSLSPDANQVAFAWNGAGQDNFDIYVQLIGGGDPVRLTSDPNEDRSPAWSPDGSKIAFLRNYTDRMMELRWVPPLGGQERRVADIGYPIRSTPLGVVRGDEGPQLAWLPDSKHIVVLRRPQSNEQTGLHILDIETGEVRQVGTLQAPAAGLDIGVSASSDGRSLVFTRRASVGLTSIYRLELNADLTAAAPARRVDTGRIWNFQASWAGDRPELFFSAADNGIPTILRMAGESPSTPLSTLTAGPMRYPTARKERLVFQTVAWDTNLYELELPAGGGAAGRPPVALTDAKAMDCAGEYSPDGKRIVFVSDRTGAPEIWVMSSDGSTETPLTNFRTSANGYATWSPDSRELATFFGADGQYELYVLSPDGGPPRRLTRHSGRDVSPSWSADGKWIYFNSDRDGASHMWRMPPEGGSPEPLKRPGRPSSDGTWTYYVRDGQLMVRAGEDGDEASVLSGSESENHVAVRGDSVFYYTRAGGPHGSIRELNLRTFASREVYRLPAPFYLGLSVSPDGRRLLFSQVDNQDGDLMLVEGVRASR